MRCFTPYLVGIRWAWQIVQKIIQNFVKNVELIVANARTRVYTRECCGMIAMKREVAATSKDIAGFPWSECQVMKLTTSHCTTIKSVFGQKLRVEARKSKIILPERC